MKKLYKLPKKNKFDSGFKYKYLFKNAKYVFVYVYKEKKAIFYFKCLCTKTASKYKLKILSNLFQPDFVVIGKIYFSIDQYRRKA